MQDGHTRKLTQSEPQNPDEFFRRFRAYLVILEGPAAGTEYPLDRRRIYVGRGRGADLRVDDPAMSEEHAALELTEEGFRVRDLGSTNGVHVNGTPVLATDLKHGDRLQLGEHQLQFVLEKLETSPRTYVLSEDS